MTTIAPSRTWLLNLRRESLSYTGCLSLVAGTLEDLFLLRSSYLSPGESARFDSSSVERRRFSFLSGRIAAKSALKGINPALDLTAVDIVEGVFSQPVVHAPDMPGHQVTISHTAGLGGAIAFPEEHPMGLDIESVRPEGDPTIRSQMTEKEKGFHASLPFAPSTGYALVWSMKESLSKVLKCGLMAPFNILELGTMDATQTVILGSFTNFSQYKVLSVVIGDTVVSITLPKRTELDLRFLAEMRSASFQSHREIEPPTAIN